MRTNIVPTAAETSEPAFVWEMKLPDEDATAALGRLIAEELGPGDCLALSGGLGAGKTTLARAIIRNLAGDPGLDVPSPTFTLMQGYDTPDGPLVHADLYRIGGPDELHEIGWDEWLGRSVLLVEWPERAGSALPPSRLQVDLGLSPGEPEARRVALIGFGAFAERLARTKALRLLLDEVGWTWAMRVPIQGDASTRAYERLVKRSGETAILMISPPRPDGPPVRRGRPYSAIAKLAESVHAFVAMDRGLRALGFSAPAILGEDLEAGLLLLENLGDRTLADADMPVLERYAEATRLLAKLHGMDLPGTLPIGDGRDHVLPSYDLEAMLIEVELLLDWYLPHVVGKAVSGSVRAEFLNLWGEALGTLADGPRTWVLRDYHSPNLIWLPERGGVRRVGLIDFQDAAIGPPAYDVVSLLQDARLTVPTELELRLLKLYAAARAGDPAFDREEFARAYALMGAQRATKVLGIFARLDRRDGKPSYLKHLPRVEAYLARNLAHPVLDRLKAWYGAQVPRLCGD
jgi:N-acetylmuramate 1-kinase